ncbi:MAG: glycosyltransferase family 2 protein [Bacteroidales bacterium]|nr:glycosyltransferase family 2 protein [Bacteroidales bacterium]MBD5206204.1 glycosyltransferase family 2 protein [Bacteroidales bacterium]MBD5223481.1 glycosyltransferase family 2 protein [Bacteroidales bacterium]MBD5303039.1 glycosyltransferase family 2 protein [Bacteroides sp.]
MKISVCMATFNGAAYIKAQIDSILSQLGQEDELVISDDSSTDNTVEIIENYADSRIRLLVNKRDKKNIEPVKLVTTNFENALKHATGDIIFMSDQDDVWKNDKVEKMVGMLQKYDYVVSDCYVTDSELNVKSESRFNGSLTKNKWKALIAPTPWQGSCAAFTRQVLQKALPFPEGLQSHDRWIGYIGSFCFRSYIMDEPLIYYRRHEDNTSSATTQKSRNGLAYKIKTRLFYISRLIGRIIK